MRLMVICCPKNWQAKEPSHAVSPTETRSTIASAIVLNPKHLEGEERRVSPASYRSTYAGFPIQRHHKASRGASSEAMACLMFGWL